MEMYLKIGIITYHYCINYGAALQAYALCKHLREMGHDSFVINYVPNQKTCVMPECKGGSVKIISRLREFYTHAIDKYVFYRMARGFADFRERYLKLSPAYHTLQELRANAPECDVYICGSDQIWKPDAFDEAYYLHFGDAKTKKVSYAPSFGCSAIPKKYYPEMRSALEKFDFISVREKSGVGLVYEIVGKRAQQVLDPTLLCSNFSELLLDKPSVCSKPYILVYRLLQTKKLNALFSTFIKNVSKRLGLQVINISLHRYRFWSEPGEAIYPTPCEWLSLIKNASLVITNSFHGTAFSVHFETPFFSFPRDPYSDQQNKRMIDFLDSVELLHRYITPEKVEDFFVAKLGKEIDWEQARRCLEAERKLSTDFLLRALVPEAGTHLVSHR